MEVSVFRLMSTDQVTTFYRPHTALLMLALLGSSALPGIAASAPSTLAAVSKASAPATTLAPPGSGPATTLAPPDSGAGGRDPFLSPPPGATDTSAQAAAPLQEAVKLSTQGAFSSPSPKVGDSLDYVVQVEWEDTQVPVIVLAPDSVDFPGFKVIGQATVHKKLASAQEVRNHTEFIFRLRAQTQGTGKAASMKLRYMTGMSRQEESVFIPTALTDIQAAPVRLFDMVWFKILLWALICATAGALGMAAYKLASRKRAEKTPKREDLKPAVAALKNRLRTAQNSPDASKEILLEMENLSLRFIRGELDAAGQSGPISHAEAKANAAGIPVANAAQARFEPMLETYLRTAAPADAGAAGGTAQDWAKLKDLFRHARFAGGYKEPHELQDAFRTFRKCLKITGEDDHE